MTRGGRSVREALYAHRWALLIAVLAFLYNHFCSVLSYSADHTHIVFEGGWRVAQGQVPYKDFMLPVGPVTLYLQALLFRVFGVSYHAYLLLGSLVNAAGALFAYFLVRAAFRSAPSALAAAGLTAVWFQPMVSLPWYTPTAVMFVLGALALIRSAQESDDGPAPFVLAGACLAAACMTKQVTGGLGCVFAGLYMAQCGEWRRLAATVWGAAAAGFFMAGVMGALSGFEPFFRQYILLPLTAGRVRSMPPSHLVLLAAASLAVLGAGRLVVRERGEWILWTCSAGFVGLSLAWVSHTLFQSMPVTAYFCAPLAALPFIEGRRNRALLMVLTLAQACDRVTSKGETYAFWYFIGPLFPFFLEALESSRRAWVRATGDETLTKGGARLLAGAVLAFLFLAGLRQSVLTRLIGWVVVIPFVGPTAGLFSLAAAGAVLRSAWSGRSARKNLAYAVGGVFVAAAGFALAQSGEAFMIRLGEVRRGEWAKETSVRPAGVDVLPGLRALPSVAGQLRAVEGLIQGLPPACRPVYVFPDHRILYLAAGEPPRDPLLWIDEGLTYRPGPEIDGEFILALEKLGANTIFVTRDSFLDPRKSRFPRFRDRILERYEEVRRAESLVVLSRCPDLRPSAGH